VRYSIEDLDAWRTEHPRQVAAEEPIRFERIRINGRASHRRRAATLEIIWEHALTSWQKHLYKQALKMNWSGDEAYWLTEAEDRFPLLGDWLEACAAGVDAVFGLPFRLHPDMQHDIWAPSIGSIDPELWTYIDNWQVELLGYNRGKSCVTDEVALEALTSPRGGDVPMIGELPVDPVVKSRTQPIKHARTSHPELRDQLPITGHEESRRPPRLGGGSWYDMPAICEKTGQHLQFDGPAYGPLKPSIDKDLTDPRGWCLTSWFYNGLRNHHSHEVAMEFFETIREVALTL
jgi:hypothetical protein